ncbi:MAG: hypothetical protein DIU70_005960 [Bacillota bacterium]|nr:MAG: hypothetical protein DIU70_08075 [Bacillota bacterium]
MLSPEALYYLIELVETGQHQKALDLAEQLLQRSGHRPEDLAHLHRLVACARFNAGDAVGALPAWRSALHLARDLGLWDLVGTLCLELGQCHLSIREPREARRALSTYFLYEHRYREAARFQPRVWANLGAAWQMESHHSQAIPAFRRALSGFLRQGEIGFACQTWHQLLLSARAAAPREVPGLLRLLKRFAQAHRERPEVVALYLLEQGLWALDRGRYWRATSLGLRAREVGQKEPWLSFEVHMLLARASQALGLLEDALGFALSARVLALGAQQYDLEFEAAYLMCELIRVGGRELVQALDRSYLAQGINIGPYLSPSLLAREAAAGRESEPSGVEPGPEPEFPGEDPETPGARR